MKGPLVCLCAAMLCLGCQAPPGAIDPFIGRQTVPPPGTGTPGSQPPGDAYYSGAPKTSANSTENSPYAPRGGFGYQDKNMATRPETSRTGATTGTGAAGLTTPASRDTTPPATPKPNAGGAPVRSANPGERPPATTSASRSSTGSGFQVNNNPNRGLPATTASTRNSATGSRPTPAQPSKDIMNLPDARPATKPSTSRESSGGFRPPGSVTRASFEEDAEVPAAGASRTPRRELLASPGTYGSDRNYRWLKGKLEYSRADDRWKLRYIPIDGDTDDFGGSAILLGSRLLEGYKPGEYITAYGTLGDTDARGDGYAPTFNLDRVVRQAEE